MSTTNGVFTPQPNKKKVMIGLKGATYSNQFLVAWTMSLNYLWKNTSYEIFLVQGFSTNQYVARLQTLGIDMTKDKDQKPFQGMDYDVFVMIDPESLFKPEDIATLIDLAVNKHDAVSGLYLITPDQYYASDATGKELLKSTDVAKDDKETVDVAFTGLGFFACKKKVLDALEYPYFTNILSDEVSFCKSIVEKGFKVMLCKELRVGRSLSVLL